jgi:hypothetical protein
MPDKRNDIPKYKTYSKWGDESFTVEEPRAIIQHCVACGATQRVDGTPLEPDPLFCTPSSAPVSGMGMAIRPVSYRDLDPRKIAPCEECGGVEFTYEAIY